MVAEKAAADAFYVFLIVNGAAECFLGCRLDIVADKVSGNVANVAIVINCSGVCRFSESVIVPETAVYVAYGVVVVDGAANSVSLGALT